MEIKNGPKLSEFILVWKN